MPQYSFHPKLVLRTPSEPFDASLDNEVLQHYIHNIGFMEALFLASPSLHEAILTTGLDKKTSQALGKYILRNRSRATPFGLFSGVGVVNWADHSEIEVKEDFERHTRLDMNYLCALAQYLHQHPAIRNSVKFFPNNSLYQIGNEIRYIEYHYEASARKHQISSIIDNEFITLVLESAQGGATVEDLMQSIVSEEITAEEAQTFIHELIDYQLLVSELEPAITGPEFLEQIILALDSIKNEDPYILEVYSVLSDVKKRLALLDTVKINSLNAYEEIGQKLQSLGVDFDKSKLFQTDKVLQLNPSKKSLSSDLQKELLAIIEKLNSYHVQPNSSHLKAFADRFYERYEDQEIPLLQALDTESGVGYAKNTSQDFTPLTEDIKLPAQENSDLPQSLTKNQEKLFNALQNAATEKTFELQLEDLDLTIDAPVNELSASFAVMFRHINAHQILLESVGGSSAANLLGRFGHAHPEIAEMLHEIADKEQQKNQGVVFAEIVHLPESRTGNILLRPAFRGFEIPYLAKSSADMSHQILPKDINVSVRNGRVILRHSVSNKVIIPRLGTAHNYTQDALPVYHFLCDMQTQGLQRGTGFSYGPMANKFVFLPRVKHGNFILHVATWQFEKEQIEQILKAGNLKPWQEKYQLPHEFVLAEGDNELYIDTENPLLLDIFLTNIKTKSSIILKEFLWDDSIPVKNEKGKSLANQFIASVIKEEPTYESIQPNRQKASIQRTFSIGSEWVYFKIYCGAKSADTILREGVTDLVNEAKEKGWIDNWFFIRYLDPDLHLRLRFHLTDKTHLGAIFELFERNIKPFEQNGLIQKIQTDTYQRELERYGQDAICQSESLFGIDSEKYLRVLELTADSEAENIKWLWALQNIDRLLTNASFDTSQKLAIIEKLRDSFAEEFHMNQDLKSQLDKKYRIFRNDIEQWVASKDDNFAEIHQNFEAQIRSILAEMITKINNHEHYARILSSHIHMLVNRSISSNQRLHELLIYDFLYRYYRSALARERKK